MKILKVKGLLIIFGLLIMPISVANCQAFDFQLITDTIEDGVPGGDDIVLKGNIINTGTVDLQIDIIRTENNIPAGWLSYMCVLGFICNSPTDDTINLYIFAGETLGFNFSFVTSLTFAIGNGLIVFKNVTDINNTFSQRLYGITTADAGINDNEQNFQLLLYPNPVIDKLWIKTDMILSEIKLYNMEGKNVLSAVTDNSALFSIDMSTIPAGIYFLKGMQQNGEMLIRKIIKVH